MSCHFLLQGIFLTLGSNHIFWNDKQILCHWATWEAPNCKNKTKNSNEFNQRYHVVGTTLTSLSWDILDYKSKVSCKPAFWEKQLGPKVFERGKMKCDPSIKIKPLKWTSICLNYYPSSSQILKELGILGKTRRYGQTGGDFKFTR